MTTPNLRKKPFYANSSLQVLVAIGMAIALRHLRPATAIAMKPLGDAFIRLITMIITLIIFCTVHNWHCSCHAGGAGPAQSGAMRPMPG